MFLMACVNMFLMACALTWCENFFGCTVNPTFFCRLVNMTRHIYEAANKINRLRSDSNRFQNDSKTHKNTGK